MIAIEEGVSVIEKLMVSIIVPVYNVANYLPQCLESLLGQTYSNIEIICVDDGSRDQSLMIIKQYILKDSRIKLIQQVNSGPSTARNNGIKVSQGEYLTFVDPDDWCALNLIEELKKSIEKNNVDIVIAPMGLYNEKTGELDCENTYFTNQMFPKELENKRIKKSEFDDFFFNFNSSMCGKLFRYSYLQDNNLSLIEGVFFEDQLFYVDMRFTSFTFSLIREPFYFYRINRLDSTTSKSYQGQEKYLNDFVHFIQYFHDRILKVQLMNKYQLGMWNYFFQSFNDFFDRIPSDQRDLFLKKVKIFLVKNPISPNGLEKSFVLQNYNQAYHLSENFNEFQSHLNSNCNWIKRQIKEKEIKYYLFGICIISKQISGKSYLFKILPIPKF